MRAMHPKAGELSGSGAKPAPVVEHQADDGMVWEEPPVPKRGGLEQRVAPLVARLRSRPGQWARVMTFDGRTSAAAQVAKCRKLFPDCEFRAGPLGDPSGVWGRYIGEK
jgi:hypothetical protein